MLRSVLLFASFAACVAHAAEPVIPLWPEGVPGLKADAADESAENNRVSNVHRPSLTMFAADPAKATGAAIIIAPGGGYARLAIDHEGWQLARWCNERGITAFVLKYRMKEYGEPAPLQDVTRAIRLVRSRAEEFGVAADRIGIMGSSAGGHVAATGATLFDHVAAKTGAALDVVSARPDFAVLLYPVITMDASYTHAGSRENLLGQDPAPKLVELYSLEKQVTAATPPTFIFYTQEDKTVPVRNGVEFFAALTGAKVPAEIHIFERGPHGMGMLPDRGPASDWPVLLEAWMRLHGWMGGP